MDAKSPTSPVRLAAREREQQALSLRKAGVDYATIAAQIGYRHAASAYNAVKRALERSAQESEADRETVRKLELERVDIMQLALWPQAQRGNQGAIDRVIKLMARRAGLLGLDAPLQVTTPPGRPLEVIRVREMTDAEGDGG